jgi:hypothetical protein
MNAPDSGSDPGEGRFRFEVPYYYAGSSAIESMSSVAAPLLAGGALIFIGIVLQQPDALRFPGAVLVVSLVALMTLILAVQCGYWARQHAITPNDVEQWWPDLPEEERLQRVRADWWQERSDYQIWARRTRSLFGAGIIVIWLALAVAAVPVRSGTDAAYRWAAVAVCLTACALEILWLVVSSRPMRSSALGRAIAGPIVNPPPFSPRK